MQVCSSIKDIQQSISDFNLFQVTISQFTPNSLLGIKMENQDQSGPFDQPDLDRTLALEVEGRKFWVRREILSAYSPVFKAMLYGDFAEAGKEIIELPGKTAADVEEFLRCLIPTPECKKIDEQNFQLILKFSDEYQIVDLRRRVEDFCAIKLDTCKTGDMQLLDILVTLAKSRMKILERCLERCVEELTLGSMVPKFNDLPDEVRSYLSLGSSGCRLKVLRESKGYCCSNSKRSSWFAECMICGENRCSVCSYDCAYNQCGGQYRITAMKKELLERMFSE